MTKPLQAFNVPTYSSQNLIYLVGLFSHEGQGSVGLFGFFFEFTFFKVVSRYT